MKGKRRKYNWISTFIATDCTTTIDGLPAEKKRHDPEGNRVASKFIPRPKMVEEYYDGMPATDIVNCNAQFLLGIELLFKY